MPKQGWLAKQVDSAEKEIEAWPEWMRDSKVRMGGTEESDRVSKPHSVERVIPKR